MERNLKKCMIFAIALLLILVSAGFSYLNETYKVSGIISSARHLYKVYLCRPGLWRRLSPGCCDATDQTD